MDPTDLPLSIKPDNIYPMIVAGIKNIPLTKYLIQQVHNHQKTELMLLENMSQGSKDWVLERVTKSASDQER
jgi:malate dehydrogenase (quinone)